MLQKLGSVEEPTLGPLGDWCSVNTKRNPRLVGRLMPHRSHNPGHTAALTREHSVNCSSASAPSQSSTPAPSQPFNTVPSRPSTPLPSQSSDLNDRVSVPPCKFLLNSFLVYSLWSHREVGKGELSLCSKLGCLPANNGRFAEGISG